MTHHVPPSSPWARFVAGTLAVVLAFGTLLLVIGALLLGMVLATGVVLWALVRGRRPGPVNLRWQTAPMSRRPWRASAGEVVDAEVREVDRLTPH